MEDKIGGLLIGTAVGNSLGWAQKAHSKESVLQLRKHFLDGKWRNLTPTFKQRNGRVRKGAVGQVTDSTEATIALVYSLLESPDSHYHWQLGLKEYIKWVNDRGSNKEYTYPICSNNIRNLFQGYQKIEVYQQRKDKHWPVETQMQAQSNDSMVRAAILAIPDLIDINSQVIEDTKLTNPSDFTSIFVTYYIFMFKNILLGNEPEVVLQLLVEQIRDKPMLMDIYHAAIIGGSIKWSSQYPVLDPELNQEPIPWQHYKFRSWVGCIFYFAIYTVAKLKIAKPLDILVTVGFMAYADTDANTAVTGAVLGAYHGQAILLQSGTLKRWWQMIQATDTKSGDYPRPERYHPKILPQLTVQLVTKFNHQTVDHC